MAATPASLRLIVYIVSGERTMAIFTKVPHSTASRPAASPRPYPLRTAEAVMAHLGKETPDEARMRREDKTLPFGTRWLGQFQPDGELTDEEIAGERHQRLARKYLA